MQELNWRRWGGQNQAALKAMQRVTDALGKTPDGKLRLKLGDITLLGSAGQRYTAATWAKKSGIPEANPVVAYFVKRHSGWQKVGELRGSVGTGLIGHLAAYHASVTGDAKARAKNLGRFLKEYERSPLLFAAVWYVASGTSRPQEWFRLFDHPRWRSLAILMAAQRANKPEQRTRIAEAFAKLHGELSEKGLEVPISTQMYSVLRSVEGGKRWQTVVRAALKVATEKDRAAPLLRFAEMALRCGERKLAEEALGRVRKLAKKPDSLMVRLALAQTYWAGDQFKDALRLYDELFAAIEAKGIAASPALLASAARLAEQAGQPGRAIDLEERALVAEHPHLPELINLNAFRQRYQWLWSQYHARVNQAAKKKNAAAVAEWLARAERLWARWHGVDGDNAAMVQQMATLQMTAGDKDAAWLYLSSLIDAKPRDPSSHGALASWYRGRGKLGEAEKWLARAYTWDTANPQWLFERAKVLRKMGRKDDARQVFQQVINGKWAPGLQRYINRAKKEIGKQ